MAHQDGPPIAATPARTISMASANEVTGALVTRFRTATVVTGFSVAPATCRSSAEFGIRTPIVRFWLRKTSLVSWAGMRREAGRTTVIGPGVKRSSSRSATVFFAVHRWATATDGNASEIGSFGRCRIAFMSSRIRTVCSQAATE